VQRAADYHVELRFSVVSATGAATVSGPGSHLAWSPRRVLDPYFWALELVKDKDTRESFNHEECETLLRGFLSPRLFERGLICRSDDRGDPVVQISPPLIAGQQEFDQIVSILGDVLAEAWTRLHP